MANHKITAYEGTENYIFISYAHKDAAKVFPIMEQLYRRGYRIWYDDGIAPGSEWPEDIARHLNSSAMVIAFVSPNSMASVNCRREINFALSKEKPFLSVVMEPTEMPLGMELQLSAQQSVLRHNYREEEAFLEKVCACPGLAPCKGTLPEQEVPVSTAQTVPEARERTSDKPVQTLEAATEEASAGTKVAQKAGKALAFWIGCAALVLIAAIVVFVLPGMNGGEADRPEAPAEIATAPADDGAAGEAGKQYDQATFKAHIKAAHWGTRMVLRGLSGDGKTEEFDSLLITEGDWTTVLVPVNADKLMLSNQSNTEKTQHIPVEDKEVWILVNKDLSYEISYTGPVQEAEQKTVTIHAKIPGSWSEAYCWAWSKDADAFDAWPGLKMTKDGNWYCAEVPSWVTGIVISNGQEQSGDMLVEAGKPMWIVSQKGWWVGFYNEPTEEDIRSSFANIS